MEGCLQYLDPWPNLHLYLKWQKYVLFWQLDNFVTLICDKIWCSLPLSLMFCKKMRTAIVISCHLSQWCNIYIILWPFHFELLNWHMTEIHIYFSCFFMSQNVPLWCHGIPLLLFSNKIGQISGKQWYAHSCTHAKLNCTKHSYTN